MKGAQLRNPHEIRISKLERERYNLNQRVDILRERYRSAKTKKEKQKYLSDIEKSSAKYLNIGERIAEERRKWNQSAATQSYKEFKFRKSGASGLRPSKMWDIL